MSPKGPCAGVLSDSIINLAWNEVQGGDAITDLGLHIPFKCRDDFQDAFGRCNPDTAVLLLSIRPVKSRGRALQT